MLFSRVILVEVDSKFTVRNTEIHHHSKKQNVISIWFKKITSITGNYPNNKEAIFYKDLPEGIQIR